MTNQCKTCISYRPRKKKSGTAPCVWLGKYMAPEAFCGNYDPDFRTKQRLARESHARVALENRISRSTKQLFRHNLKEEDRI